jgi:hypothetical protein
MSSSLTMEQQRAVARALAREYAWLGLTYEAALDAVAEGHWEDHPAAALVDERMEV